MFSLLLPSLVSFPRKIVHSKEMPNKPMIHLEIETFFDHNRKQSVMFKTLILRQCGFKQARYATIRQVWLSKIVHSQIASSILPRSCFHRPWVLVNAKCLPLLPLHWPWRCGCVWSKEKLVYIIMSCRLYAYVCMCSGCSLRHIYRILQPTNSMALMHRSHTQIMCRRCVPTFSDFIIQLSWESTQKVGGSSMQDKAYRLW